MVDYQTEVDNIEITILELTSILEELDNLEEDIVAIKGFFSPKRKETFDGLITSIWELREEHENELINSNTLLEQMRLGLVQEQEWEQNFLEETLKEEV